METPNVGYNNKYTPAPLSSRFKAHEKDELIFIVICFGLLLILVGGFFVLNSLDFGFFDDLFEEQPYMIVFLLPISLIVLVLVWIFYYLVIPIYVFKGQTIGKKMMNIKIVDFTTFETNPRGIFLRHLPDILFFLMFIFAYFMLAFNLVLSLYLFFLFLL